MVLDQGSATGHRPVAVRLPITDPRSKGIDRLITSEPTLDPGSVLVVGNKLEVMYFTTRSCPTNLII